MFGGRLLAWIMAAIAVIAGLASVYFLAFDSGSSDAQARVRVNSMANEPEFAEVEFEGPSAAMAFASEKAGFPVAIPGALPKNYAVIEIGIAPSPPVQTGSTFRRVTVKLESSQGKLNLMETNSPFQTAAQDAAPVYRTLGPEAVVYRTAGERTTDYTLLTKSRGFVLTVPAETDLSEDDIVKLLASLPLS